MSTMNNYIGDELANKVRVLSQALAKAETIILSLEQENNALKDVLIGLTSENNTDLVLHNEVLSV